MIEVVFSRPGVDWAVAEVLRLLATGGVSTVVIDRRGAAASMIQPLIDAGAFLITTDSGQMAQACGEFFDAVTETGRLRHLDQPELNDALRVAVTRPLGDAWAWDRKSGDITPLTSATLALRGLTSAHAVARPFIAPARFR